MVMTENEFYKAAGQRSDYWDNEIELGIEKGDKSYIVCVTFEYTS